MVVIDMSNSYLQLDGLYPISQIAWPFAGKVIITPLVELDHSNRRAMHTVPFTVRIIHSLNRFLRCLKKEICSKEINNCENVNGRRAWLTRAVRTWVGRE